MEFNEQIEKFFESYKTKGVTKELIENIRNDLNVMNKKDVYVLKLNIENRLLRFEKYNYSSAITFLNTINGALLGFLLGIYKSDKINCLIEIIIAIIVIRFIFGGVKKIKCQNERNRDAICYYTFYLKIINEDNEF